MTKREVRDNMRYNENLIGSYREDISNLNRQIEQLEALRDKFNNLQGDFGNRQNARRTKLSNIENGVINVKMIKTYCIGMKQFLNNAEFNRAYNGLSEAKDKINAKIHEIQAEINSTNDNLIYRQQRYYYWQSQLSSAQA